MNDLVTRINRLEKEVASFKASQNMGDSDTKIYKILENYTLSGGSAHAFVVTLTTNDRPFPKMAFYPKSFLINGVDSLSRLVVMTPRAMYIAGNAGTYSSLTGDRSCSKEIDFPYISGGATITLTFDLYADVKTSELSIIHYENLPVPG